MTSKEARDPLMDAHLAAQLFAANPARFGAIVLRGASPAREALVEALNKALPTRRLPGHVDDERLLGGIDIAASLASGKPVETLGLLAEAEGGALIVPMAERLEPGVAGRLAQALDQDRIALILLDDGIEPEDTPPPALLDRAAFHCDLSTSRIAECASILPDTKAQAAICEEGRHALAVTALALGVHSVRSLLHASEAACTHAALQTRDTVSKEDIEAAARLVLAPVATRFPPQPEDAPNEPPPPPPENSQEPSESERESPEPSLEELVVAAAAASIPKDLLAELGKGKAPRKGATGSGQKRKCGLRGKPLSARPGMPKGGARLALIDTLRTAVPWQGVRRREAKAVADAPIIIRKEDLRVRRFEEKAARVTIFVVDASGSAAAARLAEAKGAVELMLAQAYVTRSEVALIAFRGECAELLLPPTRSLTRARRALAELPGGGGTPLAMGLHTAREVARSVTGKGRTPNLVILTDGRANIAADGSPGRARAAEDAEAAARAVAREGIDALVVDISGRPGREGPMLADNLLGRYLALPRADAKALHEAIGERAREPA